METLIHTSEGELKETIVGLPKEVSDLLEMMTTWREETYCGSAHEAWDQVVDDAYQAAKLCKKYKIKFVEDHEYDDVLGKQREVYSDGTLGEWE